MNVHVPPAPFYPLLTGAKTPLIRFHFIVARETNSEQHFGQMEIIRIEFLFVIDRIVQIDGHNAAFAESEYNIRQSGNQSECGLLTKLACPHAVND